MVVIVGLVKIRPFYDSPSNHIDDLKKIDEVKVFFEKYGKYDVTVFPDGAYSYQVGIQAKNTEDQWIMLKINYWFGFPSNMLIHCTPEGIQSQYTVEDNVLEYLKNDNCFYQK